MTLAIALLLLAPASSPAEIVCAPLAELHAKINFCDNNPDYVVPAQACRDRYRATVAAKKPEIERLLNGEVSTGADVAQNLKFGTTKNVYQTTDAELTYLINLGHQVIDEVNAYSDDFVPPIPSWAPGYFKPNWRDMADKSRKSENYCYAEPMKDMDLVRNDMQQMVDELTATRAKTRQLHGYTGERDGNLAILADNGTDSGLAARRRGVSGGESEKESSTVTGRIRNESLEPAPKSLPGSVAALPLARSPAGAPAKADRSKWSETYSSAIRGRDGRLAGAELSLPSIEDARLDEKAKSSSPIAGAAELLLDQAQGGGPAAAKGGAAPVEGGASAALSLAAQAAGAGLADAGSQGTPAFKAAVLREVQAAEAKPADARDLFQRTHAAYERSCRSKRI